MRRTRTRCSDDTNREEMAPILSHVRKSAGLSQTKFGELFGLPQVVISMAESGKVLLPRAKREEIETTLGTRIKWPE